jgi:hypothetical protein
MNFMDQNISGPAELSVPPSIIENGGDQYTIQISVDFMDIVDQSTSRQKPPTNEKKLVSPYFMKQIEKHKLRSRYPPINFKPYANL